MRKEMTSCTEEMWGGPAYLSQRVVELIEDIFLIKDFALVSVFIVIMNLLTHVRWQLMEGHVLFHLLVL